MKKIKVISILLISLIAMSSIGAVNLNSSGFTMVFTKGFVAPISIDEVRFVNYLGTEDATVITMNEELASSDDGEGIFKIILTTNSDAQRTYKFTATPLKFYDNSSIAHYIAYSLNLDYTVGSLDAAVLTVSDEAVSTTANTNLVYTPDEQETTAVTAVAATIKLVTPNIDRFDGVYAATFTLELVTN